MGFSPKNRLFLQKFYLFGIDWKIGGYIPNVGGEIMKHTKEAEALKQALEAAKIRLETARNNFHYADAEEMVDYYTHLIIANEKLYGYLSRKYKELCDIERVTLDGIS